MNPLHELSAAGQSVWLDFLRRTLVTGGNLQRLIDDGVTGVTSTPRSSAGDRGVDRLRRGDRADRERPGEHDPLDVFETSRSWTSRWPPTSSGPSTTPPRGATGPCPSSSSLGWRATPPGRSRPPGAGGGARPPNVMIKVPGTPEAFQAIEHRSPRHQRERHAAVRRRRVRAGGGRVPRGSSAESRPAEPVDRSRPWPRSSSPASTRPSTRSCPRIPAARDRGGRQRQGRVRALPRGLLGRTLGAARRRGGSGPAAAVGIDLDEEPRLPGHEYVEALVGRDTVEHDAEATMDAFRDHGGVRPTRSRRGSTTRRPSWRPCCRRDRPDRRHRQAAG